MQSIPNLRTIENRYDAFILDLWGVVHDGSHLYPNVHDALTQMKRAGKKIIMLSNAPRRVWKVEAVLTRLGVERTLYDYVLSSGEAGYRWLEEGHAPWGKKFYYIGPDHSVVWTDADVLDGLDYVRVGDIKDADFLLNVGFGTEHQSTQDWVPLLRDARAAKVPMLCLNPDLEVVKQTGERFPCAGVIAHAYVALGGDVTWFGKPYAAVYAQSMTLLGAEKSRILAIGDSLETDIPGALNFGIDCALVTGGILHSHSDEDVVRLCRDTGMAPTYIMPALAW